MAENSSDIGAIKERLDKLDAMITREAERRPAAAEAATAGAVERIAKESGVSGADVAKVLNSLGLQGLARNLTAIEDPGRTIDEGRLILSLVAHRQMISA